MEDICNFLSGKKQTKGIEYYHFVYEASFRKLAQPFYLSQYRIFLAFKGEGTLITDAGTFRLLPGTLFFIFPRSTFRLEGTGNFTYLYITFDGPEAGPFLASFGVTPKSFVFEGYDHLRDFWMNAIRRVSFSNATALTESVMLYSLSFLETGENAACVPERFDSILKYIQENIHDPTLSVKKTADIHFYSEKYFSSLFKKETGVRFTEYVNRLRVERALSLMDGTQASVSSVAQKCGFSDPFYFSKVFKRAVGVAPGEYIKANAPKKK